MESFISSLLDHTSILAIFVSGAIGGVLNSILNGFKKPEIWKGNDGQVVYLPGFIGNILLGAFAAFIIWATGLGNPDPPQSYAIAMISGVSASRIFSDLLDKRILRHTTEILADELRTDIEEGLRQPRDDK